MKFAIWLSALIVEGTYVPIIVSMNSLLQNKAAWSYVTTIFVIERNRLKVVSETKKKMALSEDSGHATAVTGHTNCQRSYLTRSWKIADEMF